MKYNVEIRLIEEGKTIAIIAKEQDEPDALAIAEKFNEGLSRAKYLAQLIPTGD